MSYFNKFPKVKYNFNGSGSTQNIIDIYRSVRPLPTFLDDINGYRYYEVIDGERPDIASLRLYGTPDYYWTFFIINDFLHDGLSSWPMSQSELYEYIEKEYSGVVITTRPQVVFDGDGGVTEFRNSIAGKFNIGETFTSSTGTGKLVRKNIDMNQLVLSDVTGHFVGDPELINNPSQTVSGSISSDSVSTYRVYDHAEAPFYYYDKNDPSQRIVDLGTNIQGVHDTEVDSYADTGVAESNIAYVTHRQHLFSKNERRSRIRVIDPKYVGQFAKMFEEAINT